MWWKGNLYSFYVTHNVWVMTQIKFYGETIRFDLVKMKCKWIILFAMQLQFNYNWFVFQIRFWTSHKQTKAWPLALGQPLAGLGQSVKRGVLCAMFNLSFTPCWATRCEFILVLHFKMNGRVHWWFGILFQMSVSPIIGGSAHPITRYTWSSEVGFI